MCEVHSISKHEHSIQALEYAFQTYQSSDPTHTLTLRHRYAAQMRKRFRNLRGMIRDAIITKDVFGIANGNPGLQANELFTYDSGLPSGAFDFPRLDKKVQEFMNWLQDQVDREILEVTSRQRLGSAINQTWQNVFIEDSYKRGVQRATYEMGRLHFPIMPVAARGGIMAVLGGPFHADRLGLLYTRAFNELKGISTAMDQQISRVLTQGMGDGDNPRLLARKLNAVIRGGGGDLGITDTLGRYIPAERRAEILARTEVIRAHHQAMFQEFKNWGVQGVTVQAEFRTAGDNRVCYQCQALEDQGFFKLEVVENLIPVHPMCRCIIIPARVQDILDAVTLIDDPQEIQRIIRQKPSNS